MTHWLEFTHRNLWQHPVWAQFQQAVGRKTFILEDKDAFAVVVRHGLPFGLCWLEVPRGPLFNSQEGLEKIMLKLQHLGREQKAVFIRFSSYQPLEIRKKLHPALSDHHPETSLILDLALSEEALLAQMKPKGRYNIKLAEKHGVQISVAQSVEHFYSILKSTGGRDGFSIHPQAYYQTMLEELGDKVQLLIATYQNQVIAGGIFVYLDEWGIYYYGASDHEHRKFMAPYLLQWYAILEAKKRGCRFYDFLGIAPEGAQNHAWAGVTDFKKKFGGKVVSYPSAQDEVLRPFWYWLYKWRKRLA